MNRHFFRTKNQLRIFTYLYIMMIMIALLVFFLIFGNFDFVMTQISARYPDLELPAFLTTHSQSLQKTETEEIQLFTSDTSPLPKTQISVLGQGEVCDLLTAQLDLYHLNYSEGIEAEENDVIFIAFDSYPAEYTAELTDLNSHGTHLVFLGIPDEATLHKDPALMDLLGITSVNTEQDYTGIRLSGELTGSGMIEDEEYPVQACPMEIQTHAKRYAAALPENYKKIENDKLTPLVWRYNPGPDQGYVYVLNGSISHSEIAYTMVPMIMRELQDDFIYPIINAYVIIIDGLPSAANEVRASWQALYGRDFLSIQQDLIMPQYRRYTQVYNSRLSYLPHDYQSVISSNNNEISFFLREIEAQSGFLGDISRDRSLITADNTEIQLRNWQTDFRFDSEKSENRIDIPINFTFTPENKADKASIGGIINSLGLYTLDIDTDALLDYESEEDVWNNYCDKLEILLGTQLQNYGWIDRVTLVEAAKRIRNVLSEAPEIEYYPDHIVIRPGNPEAETPFVLRSRREGIEIQNGVISEVGTDSYLVKATGPETILYWSN